MKIQTVRRGVLLVALMASSASNGNQRCQELETQCQFSASKDCKAVKKSAKQAREDRAFYNRFCSRAYLAPILKLLLEKD